MKKISKKIQKWMDEEQSKHPICLCGCGEEITIKHRHYYYGISKYIQGHTFKGRKHTEKSKQKMRQTALSINKKTFLGKHHSQATIEKMKKNQQNHHGYPPSFESKKHTDENKEKMRQSKLGKKNPAWKGGISKLEFEEAFGIALEEWERIARHVRKRDNYTCQKCGIAPAFDVHHVIPRRIKIDNSEGNLITLCRRCHMKTEPRN